VLLRVNVLLNTNYWSLTRYIVYTLASIARLLKIYFIVYVNMWVSYFSYRIKSVGFETKDSENSFQKRNIKRRPRCSLLHASSRAAFSVHICFAVSRAGFFKPT